MDHAREKARRHLGIQTEHTIHAKSGGDIDEYIKLTLLSVFGENASQGAMCKFCKQKTVTITLLQTRSADEGMTAHSTCHNPKCGKKWTVY